MLIQEKIAQAITLLDEFDIDCWLTFTRETKINGDPCLPFLVNSDLTWHSALIICRNGETHAIVGQYDKKMVEETRAWQQVTGFVKSFKEPLQEFLRERNPRRIALNYSESSEICDGLTYGMYLTLFKTLQEIGLQERIVSAQEIVSALRGRKTASEIDSIRRAVAETEEIYRRAAGFIAPGKTEAEVAQYMRGLVVERGLGFAWDSATCPAVFSGPDTAQAHYLPTGRTIQPGHVLNMDFGVRYNSYCADLQRCYYILRPGESGLPGEVQHGFETIVRSIEEARKAMRPGVMGQRIDEIARGIVVAAGYEEFPHAVGHQVGRFAHDGTMLLGPAWSKYADRPFHPLEAGMVFTLEPRLLVAGFGIVTIEEMVLVTENGAEFISQPQTRAILIG
jgi:Xaa-Pro aminopeptidase